MVGPDLTDHRDPYSQRKPDPTSSKWIVPECRLTDELGIEIVKSKGRVRLSGGLLEKPIECTIIDKLPYLERSDFESLRHI